MATLGSRSSYVNVISQHFSIYSPSILVTNNRKKHTKLLNEVIIFLFQTLNFIFWFTCENLILLQEIYHTIPSPTAHTMEMLSFCPVSPSHNSVGSARHPWVHHCRMRGNASSSRPSTAFPLSLHQPLEMSQGLPNGK